MGCPSDLRTVSSALEDDLSRNVYCVLGIPIDAIDMQSVVGAVAVAVAKKSPLFISTPNLNFLVSIQSNSDFRESLLQSDLCTADGMPIVWIARLIGVPIKNRIAGSDIFDALKVAYSPAKPLKVYMFGGVKGVAAAACRALNAHQQGLYCVGHFYPGFGSVEEMSRDDIISNINSSGAEFLVASLGAQKGQLWLQCNHHSLQIPVRAHLGAVINFEAAAIRRAPRAMRELGFEWLWRIKEEPYLWRRYWNDGLVLVRLLFARVVPLAILGRYLWLRHDRRGKDLVIEQKHDFESVTVRLSGPATARHIHKVVSVFKGLITAQKQIILDLSNVPVIDTRFLGLLLMLRKKNRGHGVILNFIGLSWGVKCIFRLNGLGFLLFSGKAN